MESQLGVLQEQVEAAHYVVHALAVADLWVVEREHLQNIFDFFWRQQGVISIKRAVDVHVNDFVDFLPHVAHLDLLQQILVEHFVSRLQSLFPALHSELVPRVQLIFV